MLHLRPLNDGDNFPELQGGMYYIALDGTGLLGYCKYHKDHDCVIIEELKDGGSMDLFDGLLRAVFAYVMEANVNRAKFSENIDKETLKALMVPVDGQNCVNSLKDFLYNCKKCKMS